MDLKQLEYLVAIEDHGSMHAAAEHLHVTQQNISRVIKQLEGELNIQIFNRSSSGCRLTTEGMSLYNHAKIILNEIQLILNEYDSDISSHTKNTNLTGHLVFLFSNSINSLVSKYTLPFQQQYPSVSITANERSTNECLEMLYLYPGQTFSFLQISMEKLTEEKEKLSQHYHCYLFSSNPLKLITAKTNPLASRSSISLRKLAHQPFVAKSSSLTSLPNHIQTVLDKGIPLNIKYCSNSEVSVTEYITKNMAYSLATTENLQSTNSDLCVAIPIKERIYIASCFIVPKILKDQCMQTFTEFFLQNMPSNVQKLF